MSRITPQPVVMKVIPTEALVNVSKRRLRQSESSPALSTSMTQEYTASNEAAVDQAGHLSIA